MTAIRTLIPSYFQGSFASNSRIRHTEKLYDSDTNIILNRNVSVPRRNEFLSAQNKGSGPEPHTREPLFDFLRDLNRNRNESSYTRRDRNRFLNFGKSSKTKPVDPPARMHSARRSSAVTRASFDTNSATRLAALLLCAHNGRPKYPATKYGSFEYGRTGVGRNGETTHDNCVRLRENPNTKPYYRADGERLAPLLKTRLSLLPSYRVVLYRDW